MTVNLPNKPMLRLLIERMHTYDGRFTDSAGMSDVTLVSLALAEHIEPFEDERIAGLINADVCEVDSLRVLAQGPVTATNPCQHANAFAFIHAYVEHVVVAAATEARARLLPRPQERRLLELAA